MWLGGQIQIYGLRLDHLTCIYNIMINYDIMISVLPSKNQCHSAEQFMLLVSIKSYSFILTYLLTIMKHQWVVKHLVACNHHYVMPTANISKSVRKSSKPVANTPLLDKYAKWLEKHQPSVLALSEIKINCMIVFYWKARSAESKGDNWVKDIMQNCRLFALTLL